MRVSHTYLPTTGWNQSPGPLDDFVGIGKHLDRIFYTLHSCPAVRSPDGSCRLSYPGREWAIKPTPSPAVSQRGSSSDRTQATRRRCGDLGTRPWRATLGIRGVVGWASASWVRGDKLWFHAGTRISPDHVAEGEVVAAITAVRTPNVNLC